jgi:urease accessory protein
MELTKILQGYRGPAVLLTLDYEQRQRCRQRVRLDDGRIVFLRLPRGTVLRDGDCLRSDKGRVVRVSAAPESVSAVAIDDPARLARAAYHLGNRHEPLQIGDGWLRYRSDHVLDGMLRDNGFDPRPEQAPFEPERGAYQGSESLILPPRLADLPAVRESNDSDPLKSADHVHDRLQLLRLASPSLPIGSFAYSQGLEQAVEQGLVRDETTAADWLLGLLEHVHAGQELPLFVRLYRAWSDGDAALAADWNDRLIALRETNELRAEERDTGASLARLLKDLGIIDMDVDGHGYTSLFACAAAHLGIALPEAAGGFAWAWSQNQVAAAVRLVPLGQTAGQRILARLIEAIPAVVVQGLACDDADIGFSAPGLALASARHERQYTRLFLS